jgi:hypothetical protein
VSIFAADLDGKKGMPLIIDNLILKEYNNDETELIKFDISNYNIKLPENGVYIEIQALNINSSFSTNMTCFIGVTERRPEKMQIGLEVDVYKD